MTLSLLRATSIHTHSTQECNKMNESLLAHEVDHAEEEDELLWNELKDDHDHHHHHTHDHSSDHLRHHRSASALSGGRTAPSGPLPSLRAHVHLPAISTLFHNVLDSAKGSFGRQTGTAAGSSAGHGQQSHQPSDSQSWQQRTSHAPDALGRVASLDGFLISLYNHFYHKGFWSTATVEIVALFTGLFSVTLSSFLMGCVQWQKMIACNHNANATAPCEADLEDFITCSADASNRSMWSVLTSFYFVMFLGYWVFRALQLIGTLRDAYHMSAFYRERYACVICNRLVPGYVAIDTDTLYLLQSRLHIDERQLQTVKWDEVVNRVLDLVRPTTATPHPTHVSSYRLQIDPALLATPHDFARRIMRRENYLIAFMHHALFQQPHVSSRVPASLAAFVATSHVMFSRNMECNLNICLIDEMLDREHNLSRVFVHDASILQKRFLVAGVINFVLTPFILLYRLAHFFFVLAMEWHMSRSLYFVSRRWSAYALWTFREYNELPHVLDARMERSYPAAERYLSRFPAGVGAIIAGGVSFCASSLMAVFIGLSLVDESLLLKTTLGGAPLLWYLTLTTFVFTIARTFTTTTSPFLVTNGDSEEAMMELSAETHYFPKTWRGRCESYDVRDEFVALYPYKGVLLLHEFLSVLLAPYILCVSLPLLARDILLFVRTHTLVLPHTGAVCRFAEFDFKEYGHDAKMERSFVNFKQNHPQWVGGDEGEAFVQRLGQLKEEEMEKSMRLGDTMLYGSNSSHALAMSMSQQLLQSQAIHTALGGGGFGGGFGMTPQDNEFYWLEKVRAYEDVSAWRDTKD